MSGNGTKPKRGRPKGTTRVEADDDFRERLFDALAKFESKSAACAEVGISYATFRLWMDRAWKATEGFWHNFFVAYTRARAPFWEKAAQALSKRDPSIILMNECPDEWAIQKRVEVTVKESPLDLLKDNEVAHALDRAFARQAQSRQMAESGSSRN